MNKQSASATGTNPSEKPETQPETTTPHGKHGAASRLTVVAPNLAAMADREAEAAVVSLVQQCGASLRVDRDWRKAMDGTVTTPIMGVSVSCASSEDRSRALAALRELCAPAPRRVIEQWLAELSVRVIRRQGDEASDVLTLRVYGDELAKFPADVVRSAIFNGWKFWPALDAELLPRCEERAAPRRAMLRALMDWKPAEPERPRPEIDMSEEHAERLAKRRKEFIAQVMAEAKARAKAVWDGSE